MTHRTVHPFSLPALIAFTALCSAQPNLDAVVESARQRFEAPGIAVAIVKDGQVVMAKGYGVRKLGDPAPVTENTLFGIASNTKAFTAAALAMLVDEGKLKWDDPVTMHLPSFQMYDPYVAREMTIRDLLTHRSGLGLGAGDLMYFPPTDLSREEVMRRVRFVKPATSLRTRYAYNNLMFVAAGQVVAAVSGKSWDDFIRERILTPLRMTATQTSIRNIPSGTDVAWPHAKGDGKMQAVPASNADNWGAAAALNSNVVDMAKWMILQLNHGKNGDTRLFSDAVAREMWTPQMLMPTREPPKETAELKANFAAYGFGWNITEFRGRKLVSHTGGLAGMVTRTTLIPELNLGVVVLTNHENGNAFNAVTYAVLDHYCGAPASDWVSALETVQKRRDEAAEKAVQAAAAKRNKESRPSLPQAAYAGHYRDAWYGDVVVEERDGKLRMRFTHTPDLVGTLEHWQYDTFVVRWDNRTLLADAYVTFTLKADGVIDEVKMAAVSSQTDFSFDFQDLLLKPVSKDTKAY